MLELPPPLLFAKPAIIQPGAAEAVRRARRDFLQAGTVLFVRKKASAAPTNLTSGITPSASFTTNVGTLASLVDDDHASTEWTSTDDPASGVANKYFQFDLGSNYRIIEWLVTGRDGVTYSGVTLKTAYSDNAADWTDVNSGEAGITITGTAESGVHDISAESPGSHRYWRLIFVSIGTGTSRFGLREVIGMGTT